MSIKSTYALGHSQAATASHASRKAEIDAAFVLPHLKPGFRILDAGCGPGTITSGLCKYVAEGHVIGIDNSAKVIAKAEELANDSPGGRPQNLEFFCMNILQTGEGGSDGSLSLPDSWKGSFDVIFESQVLVHMPTPIQAIKNLKACLKPGGILATRDYDPTTFVYWKDPSGYLSQWAGAISKMVAHTSSTSLYGGREVPFYLNEAGFEQSKITSGASTLIYSTPEQRKWWGDLQAQRLAPGNETRENMIKSGVPSEQCEHMSNALVEWANSADGIFYCIAIECVAIK